MCEARTLGFDEARRRLLKVSVKPKILNRKPKILNRKPKILNRKPKILHRKQSIVNC